MAKKHNQYILCIDAEAFGQREDKILFVENKDYILDDDKMNDYLSIRQRHRAESLERYRQVLPYNVLYSVNPDGTRLYYPYRRTSGVGESRLAGNVSLGYGGHIDDPDLVINDNGSINLRATIVGAVNRERAEETIIHDIDDPTKITTIESTDVVVSGVILQVCEPTKNGEVPVGNVHAGFVIMQEIYPGTTVSSGEDELKSMPPMTRQELLDSGLPLEDWTRLFLELEDKFIENHNRVLTEEYGYVSVDANYLD